MTCSFCGSRNGIGEHRCRRCGRREGDTLTGEVTAYRTHGQLAMQVEPQVSPELPAAPIGRAYQTHLFPSANNVIPIESYVPVEPRTKPQRGEAAAPAKPRAPRRRPVPEEQGSLEFLAPAQPKPRTLETTVEAVIFCDAPAAVWLHRAVASALDWFMVLIAYGVFMLTFHLLGGSFTWQKTDLLILGGVLPLFALAYRLTFAIAGTDTPGMIWTRLKLLTFDGYAPDIKQRLFRVAGAAMSLSTVIGLAWSLVDEECLAWQDHMTRTFPTPREAENLTLIRR